MPRVSLSLSIVTYFIFSLMFFILGSIIIANSKTVVRFELRYDNLCPIGQ